MRLLWPAPAKHGHLPTPAKACLVASQRESHAIRCPVLREPPSEAPFAAGLGAAPTGVYQPSHLKVDRDPVQDASSCCKAGELRSSLNQLYTGESISCASDGLPCACHNRARAVAVRIW